MGRPKPMPRKLAPNGHRDYNKGGKTRKKS